MNFDLIEPACMDGSMYLNCIVMPAIETINIFLPSVSRTVVGDPKNPARRSVGFLRHDKVKQAVKAANAGPGSAQAKNFSLPDIPGRRVSQSSHPSIFMLDAAITPGAGWGYRCHPLTCLDTGFFIRGDDKIIVSQVGPFPDALAQVENSRSFSS